VVDDDILNSTNTSFGAEIAGYDSYLGSTLTDNLSAHYSVHYPSAFNGAVGLGYDDPLDFLPLSTNLGNSASVSAPCFGNLESVSSTPADVHASFDYDFGHSDFLPFPFDDYLIIEPDQLSTTSQCFAATFNDDALHASQLYISSSPSQSPDVQGASENGMPPVCLTPSTDLCTAPAAKVEIEPSSSFECEVCHKTFAFESRYKCALPCLTTPILY